MNLAIMQPYLFPYIGYFQLIAHTDKFVFFDIVQYNKRTWMNRNRILHPNIVKPFQYISVPIKKQSKDTLIKDTLIDNSQDWQKTILGHLSLYKKLNAPYYDETIKLLKKIFEIKTDSFLELTINSTNIICKYLDIKFNYTVASSLDINNENIKEPGDWALEISKLLQAKNYINPYSGYKIFEQDKFDNNNIKLNFLKSNLTPYKQSNKELFTAGLSILDILMFNKKDKIKKLIDMDFNILSKQELENNYE